MLLIFQKSPKNKSPKTYKICPTKKVAGSGTSAKKTGDPNKDEQIAGRSEKYSVTIIMNLLIFFF